MPYTFNTDLLSAEKTGFPNLIGTALSANGVNVISLSSVDQGIAFNALTTLNNVLSTVTVTGSVFRIDTAYNNAEMALVKVPVNDLNTFSVFTFLSATAGTVTPTISGIVDVSTANTTRLRVLGYR